MEPAGAYPVPVHSARKPRWVAPPPASRSTTRRASVDGDRPERRPGIRALDGLRALAVGLVLADHGGIPGMAGGFLGVDVFFVLSGFLITSLLLDELGRTGRDRPGQLLDPAGPATAARAGPDGADGGRRTPTLRTGGDRQPARRRRRRLLLGGELDVRRGQDRLLRSGISAVAAAARLVTRRGRAVLHRLAAGTGCGGPGTRGPRTSAEEAGHRRRSPSDGVPARHARSAGVRRGRDSACVGRDPRPGLFRHRHPGAGAAGGRRGVRAAGRRLACAQSRVVADPLPNGQVDRPVAPGDRPGAARGGRALRHRQRPGVPRRPADRGRRRRGAGDRPGGTGSARTGRHRAGLGSAGLARRHLLRHLPVALADLPGSQRPADRLARPVAVRPPVRRDAGDLGGVVVGDRAAGPKVATDAGATASAGRSHRGDRRGSDVAGGSGCSEGRCQRTRRQPSAGCVAGRGGLTVACREPSGRRGRSPSETRAGRSPCRCSATRSAGR